MTCPDPANNRECMNLYNGECLEIVPRRYYECGIVYEQRPGEPRRIVKDLRNKESKK